MLNGIDPIIIFNFFATPAAPKAATSVPVAADQSSSFPLPFVPIYLSEQITGLYIDNEDKNIDIMTDIETLTVAADPKMNQRGINNTVKINMSAVKGSIGMTLLSAMSDLIFPKVTSKEYSITYLHGAITVFAGLLHTFSISQDSGTDLYKITLELIRPGIVKQPLIPNVTPVKDVVLTSGSAVG